MTDSNGKTYHLMPPPERAPQWWIDLYAERQTDLRAAIRRALHTARHGLGPVDFSVAIPLLDDREIADALGYMHQTGEILAVEHSLPAGTVEPRYRLAEDGGKNGHGSMP